VEDGAGVEPTELEVLEEFEDDALVDEVPLGILQAEVTNKMRTPDPTVVKRVKTFFEYFMNPNPLPRPHGDKTT
jgi:hypothetical protein